MPLVEPVTNAILLVNILFFIDVRNSESSTSPMVKKRKFWIRVPSYRM
jgi:hypothetical protein